MASCFDRSGWLRRDGVMRLAAKLGAVVAALTLGASPALAVTILMVTDGSGTLTSNESSYKSYLESLGYTVTTVWDNASQATIDAAWAAAHVVYVPYSVTDWELGDKLRLCTKGVVSEERYLDDNYGMSTQPGWDTSSYTAISITDNTHYITKPFSTGSLTIFSSSQPMTLMNPTYAAGLQMLAEQHFGNKALTVLEVGATLANTVSGNSIAAGRRVHLPWGGDTFNIASLNSNAQVIGLRAIEWAINDDRILHIKLNETSGTTAADSSVYARNGTVTGTAAWVAARRHNGFDFNGSTKIEVNSLLGNPSDFTVACWARIDAADTSGADGVSLGDCVTLRLHDTTGGGPKGMFYAGSSTWRGAASSTSYVGRGWHHFAVTFDDASDSLKLWVDGVNVATTSTTSSVSWSGLGSKTRLGQHGNAGTDTDLDGALDDVRVYRKALTQSEIANLYGLVGHWKLSETSGTTATDSSGKTLNGTYANGPVVGQSGPYPGGGQYAANFDGVNDRVDGAAASNYSFDDGFSIAGWVNFDAHIASAALLQNGSTTQNCELSFSATGQVTVAGRSSGGLQSHTSTATLPLGRWKHVVGTYDGTTFRTYIDGVLSSSANNSFTVSSSPSGNVTLAASPEGTAQFLDGRAADVRLYNRAIAAEEVHELFGLLGRWKLDETSGVVAADAAALGLNGTYTNGPVLAASGAYDYAIVADGSDDYAAVPETPNLRVSSGLTMSAWVRPATSGNATRMIVNKEGEYEVALTTTGEIEWALTNTSPGWNWHTTGATVPNNRWSHILVMYDGTSVKTYVNGQLKESYSGSGSVGDAHVSLNEFRIGGRSNSPSGQYFAGRLDEVRVYNRAVSNLEIAELSGLWGHWKFNEGSGTTTADATLNANNANFNAGSPNWVSGIYSGALEFDGPSDDAITGSTFYPPSEGTVALWFRSDGAPTVRQRPWGLGGNFEMWQDPDGLVSCDIATDGYQGGCITTTPLSTAGRWYHLAVVFDSDDESYKIYLNGQLHKSGVSSWGTSQQAANYLSFGTRTGTTDRFDGALDDFRVYNRKLDASEVSELYGMLAWYKFDETSGTVATDSTGLGNDGTFVGSPTLNVAANGAASQGTAVAFNGTNSMQASGLFDRSTSVSASAWVRLDGVDSGGAEVVTLGDYFRIRLKSGASGAEASYYNGSTWVTATASQYIVNAGWHHVAAVLDGGNTLKLYIDGIEAASTAASGAITYTGQGTNSFVAAHGNSASNVDLTGRVDDVRIFNRLMKPEEVFQLYRGSRISGIKILKWVEAR